VAGESYDYIIGLVITGMLFISAVIVVPNVSYVNLLYVDQQQLRNVALETLKAMLLDTGYPVNWGSIEDEKFDPNSSEDLQRFGLASSAGGSFYVLDPNKVQRLDMEKQSPYWNCVGYNRVRDLLGLEGYGFSLSILPPFNVTISDKSFNFTKQPYSVGFKVKVLRHDGRPLANAAVHTTIIYSVKNETTGNVTVTGIPSPPVFTDSLGRREINIQLAPLEDGGIKDVTAVLRVTVADIATVVSIYHSVSNLAEIIKIGYIGDTVTLAIPEEAYPFDQPNEADWVCNVAAYYDQEDIQDMYSGGTPDTDKITWGQGYKTWNRNMPGIQSSNPALMILVISCVPKGEGDKGKGMGRTPILIVCPGPNYVEPKVLQFGGKPQGTTVKVQRNVLISGMKHIAEITLWKESL